MEGLLELCTLFVIQVSVKADLVTYLSRYGTEISLIHIWTCITVLEINLGLFDFMSQNLDKSIDHKALHETFSAFGPILSCKVAVDPSGQSKGYGFVQYDTEEAAQRAIEQLNGMLLNDKQVYVGPFVHKQQRDPSGEKVKFNNVYVKNLSESMSDEELKKVFGEFGVTTSCVIMRDGEGKSKGFGFVNFENAEDAAKAVEALNGKTFDDKEWFVGRAQKKSERENELKQKYEQSLKEAADKSQGSNLYVKNLDESVTDEKLKEHFAPFGTITSCKVCHCASLYLQLI